MGWDGSLTLSYTRVLSVSCLPSTTIEKKTLQSMKSRDRDEIIRVVSTRYSSLPQKKGRSARPDRLNMRSSRAKVKAGAVHYGVTVATAGAAGAAAVAGTAEMEMATAVPVVLAVVQVDPKEAVEATTAPVGVGVVAAEVVVIPPPAAAGAAGGGATGERSAPRRRAISCPDALGAQVLATRRVSDHQT